MKKIKSSRAILLLLLMSTAMLASCTLGGEYSGDVVVIGKNVSVQSNSFHSETMCWLYGEINGRPARWMVTEYEYNCTNVGDTAVLYHTDYWIIKE